MDPRVGSVVVEERRDDAQVFRVWGDGLPVGGTDRALLQPGRHSVRPEHDTRLYCELAQASGDRADDALGISAVVRVLAELAQDARERRCRRGAPVIDELIEAFP